MAGKSKSKSSTQPRLARTQPSKSVKKGKSTPPKAAKATKKTKSAASNSSTPALFSGNEGANLRGRINRFFDQPHGQSPRSTATPYPAAYREAVQTKKGTLPTPKMNFEEDNGEGSEGDDAEEGTDGQEDDTDADADDDSESGSGEGSDDGSGDEAAAGAGVLLDEEEEREMRMVKGKGKNKENVPGSSIRGLRFGGVVMLDAPFPKDGKLSKPTPTAVKRLEGMGLAVFDTQGFMIPAHATHEEVDQILGEILPTPIDHLRSRLDGDDDVPVWELLKAEFRNLYRTKESHPAAAGIRATWGEGRSIASKTLFICPAFPFSKKILSQWRSNSRPVNLTPSELPTTPKAVGPSRKRKHATPSEPDDNKNCNDSDHEHKRKTKKMRIMSPVDDARAKAPHTPHKPNTRSSSNSARHKIDLTTDDQDPGSTGVPLRERQVFLLSSPELAFDPYSNSSRYFSGL